MPNWNDRAKQLQDRAQLQGDSLQNEARNDQSKYNDRLAWGQGSADELYNQLNGTPGYTPGEAGQINADYGQFRTPQGDLDQRYLTGDEQQGIRGNPYRAMEAYDPNKLADFAGNAAIGQDATLGQQEGNLKSNLDQTRGALDSAADDPSLGLSGDYTSNASTGLNQTQTGIAGGLNQGESGVRGAISSNLGDYKMTPEQQQDIVTGAGISAGMGYRASEDTLQRQAAAAGANPMGIGAYRARAERSAAAEGGDAMTQARIATSDAAAKREMGLAQLETGTESDLAKQRVAGVEASGKMQQDVLNTNEQMRLKAQQDIADRKMQAGTTAGQLGQQAAEYTGSSRLNTQGQNADRSIGVESANQKTGQGLLAAGENAASTREGQIAGNRQTTTGNVQDTGYKQGMETTGATAAGAQAVGNARIAGEKEARGYYTGQGGQAQTGALTAAGQKLGAYGEQTGAENAAIGSGVKANSSPGLLQNIAGTAIGAAGAASKFFAQGGVATEPTMATIGEEGPEAVVPLDSGGVDYTGDTSGGQAGAPENTSIPQPIPQPPPIQAPAPAAGRQLAPSNPYRAAPAPQQPPQPIQGSAGGWYRDASGNLTGGQAPPSAPAPQPQGQYGRPAPPQQPQYRPQRPQFHRPQQPAPMQQPQGAYSQPQQPAPMQQPQQSQQPQQHAARQTLIQHQGYRARPMAEGQIVTEPTQAIIGESGPEAVVPLDGRQDANVRPGIAYGREMMRRKPMPAWSGA